ncbi:hypothetical protein [Streptomyces sp. NPDC005209]|uniref:hypothetical protein n=1 Tax=Streptomyces sp. NPDC005209 TaxID=3156715 RepID=UPI0033BA0991
MGGEEARAPGLRGRGQQGRSSETAVPCRAFSACAVPPCAVVLVVIDEVDYVRETTRVSARYPAVPGEGGEAAPAQDAEPREQVTVS